MGGSKPSALAKLPKGQRCHFLLGPVSSWFMPNISDIWTQPPNDGNEVLDDEDPNKLVICCDQNLSINDSGRTSFYAYGSFGCFCYGMIETCDNQNNVGLDDCDIMNSNDRKNLYSVNINNLIDIKEDNSKVTCLRFNKTSLKPFVMVLTENGTLLIHDCLNSENIIHYKKNELVNKLIGDRINQNDETATLQLKEHQPPSKKRARMTVVYQQINSFVWPHMKHAFLGISLLKEKTNLLIWIKIKDLTDARQANGHYSINKTDLIESHEILNLNLEQNHISPICCMETSNTISNDTNCIIAIAMDNGLIIVVNVNYSDGQSDRIIKLSRHNDQICSLSLYTGDIANYPMGLLASISRSGLALVWDIDSELCFADYHGSPQEGAANSKKDPKINWFSMSFIKLPDLKRVHLAVSNSSSGISVLEIPEKVKSTKVRLLEIGKLNQKRTKNNRNNKQRAQEQKSLFENSNDQSISHHALIFNLIFDPISSIISTCSLDGNHIIWSCKQQTGTTTTTIKFNKNEDNSNRTQVSNVHNLMVHPAKLKAEYLIPTMHNNARTHAIRFNPIREELLALALGKAGLRFYSVPKNSMSRRFNMTTSHNLIVRQVSKANISPTSLAWNPGQEYRLAIGTNDGKVLRADLMPRKSNLVEAKREEFLEREVKKPSSPSPLSSANCSKLFEHDQGDLFDVEYRPVERIEEVNSNTYTKVTDAIAVDAKTSALHNQKVAIASECANSNACRAETDLDKTTDAIYSLCWGPHPHEPSDLTRSAIYAVGITSHRLFIYYSKKENSEKLTDYMCGYERARQQSNHKQQQQSQSQLEMPEMANLPEARDQATKVLWKSSMDLMSLGTISGKIIIVSYKAIPKNISDINDSNGSVGVFERLAVLEGGLLGNSYIQCLAWHPNADKESANYYYLACSSNESPILIYNLKSKCSLINLEQDDKLKQLIDNDNKAASCDIEPIFSLNAHKKAISDIAWNPHEPNQLASCSFDRNCFVWHLHDGQSSSAESTTLHSGLASSIVSKFSARDRLFTLEWHLDDEDLILTSGNDSTIWAWRPSENIYSVNNNNNNVVEDLTIAQQAKD